MVATDPTTAVFVEVFKGLSQSEALFAQVEMHIINAAFEGLGMWANDHDEAVPWMQSAMGFGLGKNTHLLFCTLGLLLDMCFLQNLGPVLPSNHDFPLFPGSIWETGLLDPSRPASWFSSVAIVPGPSGTRETTTLRSDVAHHALGCLYTW